MERTYTPLDYEPEDYVPESEPVIAEPEKVKPSSTDPAPATEPPPAAAEPAPAEPETSRPAAPRARKYTPIDYEPEPAEDGWSKIPKNPIGSGTAIGRGLIGGTIDVKRQLGDAYEGFNVLRGSTELDLSEDPVTGYERRVPSLANIKDVDTGLTWLGETLGSAIPQFAPTIATAAVGTGIGGLTAPVTGPAGAFAGRAAGGLAGSIIQNFGDVWGGFKQDAGIRKLLDDKQVEPMFLAQSALAASALIGTLDAVSLGKITNKLGLSKELSPDELALEIAKKWTIASIAKRGGKGMAWEGITEAAQSMIAQAAEIGIGGNWDMTNRVVRLFDEFAGGAVQGGPAAALSPPADPKNNDLEVPPKPDDQPGEAAPVLPEGTPAPVEAAPAAEQATPGGLSATTPAPPAGLDKQPAEAEPAPVPEAATDPGTLAKPPAPVLPEPGSPVTVVGQGETAPDVAEALPTRPAAQAPAEDEGITEGAIPAEQEEAGSPFMRQMLARHAQQQDASVAAALQESLPAAPEQAAVQPPVIPPAPQPEVLGTAGARWRQDAPADATLAAPSPAVSGEAVTPENALPAAASEVSQEQVPSPPIEPAPAPQPDVSLEPTDQGVIPVAPAEKTPTYTPVGYDPEPFTPEDFEAEAAAEPAESDEDVPAVTEPAEEELAPAAAYVAGEYVPPKKKPETVVVKKRGKPAPKEEVKPSSTEGATPTKTGSTLTKAQRELHDEVTRAVPPDLETHPHGKAAIEEAVREHKSPVRPREEAHRKAQVEQTLEAARKHAKRRLDEEVAAVGSQAQQELDRAKSLARERETKGKPQERKRRGKTKGKAAEDVAIQSPKRWNESVEAERAKPAEEQNQDLIEYGAFRDARNKLGARDPKRASLNKEMDKAKERYLEGQRQAEEARKPAPAPVPETPAEAPALTQEEQEAILQSKNKEAEKQRAQQAAARREKTGTLLEPAVDAVAIPDEFYQPAGAKVAFRKSVQMFDREMRAVIKQFRDAVRDALKDAKLDPMAAKPAEFQSPEEWLGIFANQILHGELKGEFEGMENTMFATALTLYRAGDIDGLWEQISGTKRLASKSGDVQRYHKRKAGTVLEREEKAEPTDQALIVKNKWFKAGHRVEPLQTLTGAEALTRAGKVKMDSSFTSPFAWVRKMHSKALRQMVGDTPVHIISREDMDRIANKPSDSNSQVAGLFMPYGASRSPSKILSGKDQPAIFIAADSAADPHNFAHTLMHEMTHAATSYALHHDIRGMGRIIRTMRTMLEAELRISGAWEHLDPELHTYGFTNDAEFVAEAFSNPNFQNMLMHFEVSPELAATIGSFTGGKPRMTWWQAFTKAVSNALGILVPRGDSYFEQILKLQPDLMMTSAEIFEDRLAKNPTLGQIFSKPFAKTQLNAAEPLILQSVNHSFDATRQAVEDKWYSLNARTIKNRLATTYEQMRRSDYWFGTGADNKFRPVGRLLLSARNIRNKLANPGRLLVRKQLELKIKDRPEYDRLSENIHEATLLGMDPQISLADNITAGNVSKAGDLDAYKRAAFPELKKAYDALKPATQQIYADTVRHHKDQENTRRTELTKNALAKVVDFWSLTLPTSQKQAVEDIMEGLLDADPATITDPVKQARATALRQALGKHADSLGNVAEMRSVKGVYVPLMRWGKYVITATQQVKAPPGGTIDPQNPNQILFDDKAAYKAYVNANQDQIDRVGSEWWDPVTGKRTQKKASVAHTPGGPLTYPVQVFRVHVMNRLVEMDDSEGKLARRREDLVSKGFQVTQVVMTDKEMARGGDLMPSHITKIMNAMDASGTSTIGKTAFQHALQDAYVRTLMNSRAQHRRLKRQGIQGFNRDLVNATNNANHIMSGHIANLQLQPQLDKASKELNEWVKQEEKNDYGVASNRKHIERQAMVKELYQRIEHMQTRNEDHWGQHALRNVLDLSFLTHLASPAYTIVNLMQTVVTSLPVLGAAHGMFRTGREMARAAKDLGVHRTVVRGVWETGREAVHAFHKIPIEQYNHHEDAKKKILRAEPAAKGGVDLLEQMGLSASGGIEAPEVSEMNKNWGSVRLTRTVRAARAAPESAEAVNRYTTFLAAWRLARQDGMSIAEADEYAVSMVEKTQGGYASENNPSFLSGKWLAFPLQFKKYPLMYGQMYYGAVMRTLGPNPSKADRWEAAKQTAYLSATTMAFAGVGGLPFIEFGRAFALAALAIGGDEEPWKWDDYENAMEEWFADMTKFALGKHSAMAAEALVYGATRFLGIDTSSRMGNSSSVLFGEPKKSDEMGVKAWLFELTGGAGLDTIGDTIQAFQGDISKLPMPKAFQDIYKAYTKSQEGTVTKTGRQVGKEFTTAEAVAQGLGFRPRKDVRSYEAGGSGTKNREEQRASRDRTNLMGEWAKADSWHRPAVWTKKIMKWNREHPDQKITRASLQKSLNRRKQQAKEDKKMREEQD